MVVTADLDLTLLMRCGISLFGIGYGTLLSWINSSNPLSSPDEIDWDNKKKDI
jgi:hypothetical protein